MTTEMIFVLTGAFAGGFVAGLTGFGTGITALVFWLHAVPPAVASPLVVICSVIGQLQTLHRIWHAIVWKNVLPYIVGGLAGVPVGTYLLAQVSVGAFKTSVGVLLIVYCTFTLLKRVDTKITWGGRAADSAVGLGGGILGGLAGTSAPLPTIWTGLRGMERHARRGVLQTYNLAILFFATVAQAFAGFITLEVLKYVLIAFPGTVAGAWIGRWVYDRLSDVRFGQAVLVLLLFSGIMLTYGGLSALR